MVTEVNEDEEDEVIRLHKQLLEEFTRLNLEASSAAPIDDSVAISRPLLPDIDAVCCLESPDLSTFCLCHCSW